MTGLRFPLSTLRPRRYRRRRMTRGHGGSLLLPRATLSSATPCRFIPAHWLSLMTANDSVDPLLCVSLWRLYDDNMEYACDKALCRLLRGAKIRFRRISRKQRWQHQQRWRECYCVEVKTRTGKWTHHRRDWHTFDFGFARCLLDAKALHAYHACSAEDFLVIPEGNQ